MRFAPLALLAAAFPFAAGFACDIHIDRPDGECPVLAEVCPNLTCDDGFATDDEGCEICECAAPIDPPDQSCTSDTDCGDGQLCDLVNFCESSCGTDDGMERPSGESDPINCAAVCEGRCVDAPAGCAFDGDCPAGFICQFSNSTEPAPCGPECDGSGGSGDMIAPPPDGVCVEQPPSTLGCFSDFDCAPGEICTFDGGSSGGAAPPAPACDPDTNDCESDPMPPPPEGKCQPSSTTCTDDGVLDSGGVCRDSTGQELDLGCCSRAEDECFSDEDCPNGFCSLGATCAGLDCPPPPPNQCVFPSCDDDSQAVCDMMTPVCPAGQTAAVRTGCFECVDARTCGATCADGVDCG